MYLVFLMFQLSCSSKLYTYKCHKSWNAFASLVVLSIHQCTNSEPPSGDLAAAFEKHFLTYGGLDICITSAGIGNPIPFNKDQTDGTRSWRYTVNVNLTAAIDSTRLAVSLKCDLVILIPFKANVLFDAAQGNLVYTLKEENIRIHLFGFIT